MALSERMVLKYAMLPNAEAVAGLVHPLCLGWAAAGRRVHVLVEHAAGLMLLAGPGLVQRLLLCTCLSSSGW